MSAYEPPSLQEIPLHLNGKRALITGAAGGIGAAAARLFAAGGAQLALVDRKPLDELARELPGDSVSTHQADVSDKDAVERVVAEAVARWEGLDVIIANAGINRDGFLHQLSDDDWEQVIRVNLTSVFLLCRASFPVLSEPGSIVVTSSVSALGNLGQSNYAASKAGLIGLVKSLSLEGASRGIRVNAVAPGFTDTAMVASIPEKVREKLIAGIPLKRMASASEVAEAMLFLASDRASYITGQVLFVDGGASVGL